MGTEERKNLNILLLRGPRTDAKPHLRIAEWCWCKKTKIPPRDVPSQPRYEPWSLRDWSVWLLSWEICWGFTWLGPSWQLRRQRLRSKLPKHFDHLCLSTKFECCRPLNSRLELLWKVKRDRSPLLRLRNSTYPWFSQLAARQWVW